MIMDKKEKLPHTDSLLDKLTIRIASEMDDEYRRKLSMQQASSIENKCIREPSLDIDKELMELESLIKNLQTEIVEMTKNANGPPPEYKPNNDIAGTKVNQNIFDSLPPITANDIEATFKSLWNSSNPDTTTLSDNSDVTISDELKNELQKEFFGDTDFMNSLNNIKRGIESDPSGNDTDKNIPIPIEESSDNIKNKNIKTGLIMRIFGPNENTSKTDNLHSSISQRIFDIFSRNKSQTPIPDNNNEPEVNKTSSSLGIDNNYQKIEQNLSLHTTDVKKSFLNDEKPKSQNNNQKAEHNSSLDSTDVKKSFINDTEPKLQLNIASENKPKPPKNSTTEDIKESSSIKNLLSKIEQGLVSTIIGTKNNISEGILKKNNDKIDPTISRIEDVININKDSDSKSKITHKVNVINIYIETPKAENCELPITQNKTSVTKIHQGPKGRTSSTSMNSKNVSITQLKQTSGTDSVFNDNAKENTVRSCQKNNETAETINKGNSKSASLFNTNNLNSPKDSDTKLLDSDNNSTEFIKTGIYQLNKRIMSDPNVLKSRDRFDRPFESTKNELPKDCEMQENTNLLLKKISNTRKPDENIPGHVYDCRRCDANDSFGDLVNDAPDNVSNNNSGLPIEKPVIVIQFSEQPNVLQKEIVITKPIASENNTFKVYTRSQEDLVKDRTDLYRKITGEVETDSSIVETKSIDEKNIDEKTDRNDEFRCGLRDSHIVPKNQPIYINSTLITINNIDSNSDEFEDSQDFIEEPAAMENPKKPKSD